MNTESETLYDATLRLLREVNPKVGEMCRELAPKGVNSRFVSRLRSGDVKEPGVHKVQAVHDWLRANKGQDADAA